MEGWDVENYKAKCEAFGWKTIAVDGHNFLEIEKAFRDILSDTENHKPTMIVAKTVKGKGVSFLENLPGWHGKTLNKEELARALEELGEIEEENYGSLVGGGIYPPREKSYPLTP